MNRDETKKIIEIITRAYPRMKIVETKEDVDLWHECLEDLEYSRARKAVINLVKVTKDFPPDIAAVREEYNKILAEDNNELAEIRRFYIQTRNYYPCCGEYDYGWKEFFNRAKTKDDAEKLCSLIINYVNYIDRETKEDEIDFAECIRTIRRDSKTRKITVGGNEDGAN